MDFFKNMKTRSKLMASFIFMAIIVVALSATMIARFLEMKAMFYSFHHDRLIPAVQLGGMEHSVALIRLGAVRIANEQNPEVRQKTMDKSVEDQKKVNDFIEKISAKEMTIEEKKLFDEIKPAWKAYDDSRLVTYHLALQGKLEEARQNAYNDAGPKFNLFNDRLEKLIAIQGEVGIELYKEAEHDFIFARNLSIGMTIVAVTFAIGMALVLANFIATPLNQGVNLAEAIAGGDLTHKVDASMLDRDDEIGQLMKSLDKMSENLKCFMGSISQASNQIASASEELSSTAGQMSKGMQQQTSQTSQIAFAMEEMSATVLEVAKNSQSAASSAKEATATAQTGGDVVAKTVGGMQRIAETVQESARTIGELGKSSDQIGEIVAVIDDIADQTNLLALNAAIEAARAGEQGRGFAVVADEVRKLAERTTKATKEIATMIKNIQKETSGAVYSMEAGTREVKDGVTLANQAGESLRMVMAAVDRVNDMISQIATASEQQSSAAEAISNNIEEIASVTKETASGSGQSAAASQQLSEMAAELQRMVGQFKI